MSPATPTGGAALSIRSGAVVLMIMWAIYIVEVLSGGIV